MVENCIAVQVGGYGYEYGSGQRDGDRAANMEWQLDGVGK